MAAKDFYHNKVKNALIKDGWNITHDPYIIDIPVFAYNYFESMRLIQLGIEKYQVKLIIFDHDNETIESWIN